MPVLEIHLVVGQHTPDRLEELLRRVSECYASVLEFPIARTRAFLTMHEPHLWATGGVPASVDGDPAPYVVATVLQGCPEERRRRLLGELTDTICDVLGATRSRVRGRLVTVPSEDWAVGGVPTAGRRRDEVVARSSLV